MTRLELRAFESADIDAAGRLLADRHARHRRTEPLLDPRCADPTRATAEVAAAFATDGASGAVALVDGRLVGYLLGAPKPDRLWGPNMWVESAGIAVTEPETARDLYAVAAAPWVAAGRRAHYALLPSHDTALVDAWFRLGFGLQHVHGIREVATFPPPRQVAVRLARRDDVPQLAALDIELPAHQVRSPVFSSVQPPSLQETIDDWAESFDDQDYRTFVAERDGHVVGAAVGCALAKSSLHNGLAAVRDAGFLGFAAVLPEARGCGVGRALGEAVIGWAGEAGFRSVVTDWRATNLLSSRTWPRLGFRPTFLRLHRLVGH